MSKFVIVKKVPETLGKGEAVITAPSFLEQVQALANRGVKRNVTAINQMRDILNAIQQKYELDLKLFKIPFSQYEGRPFTSTEDLNKIIVDLLKKERPEVFEKILEYNIRNRPYGSKLIYYVGNLNDTGPFFKQGIEMIEEKDVDEFLGLKPKKTVGKPAVTKEQSEESAS